MADLKIKGDLRKAIEAAGVRATQESVHRARARTNNKIMKILQEAPPPRNENSPKIRWTTEKQHNAFFRTGGFGRGIPTRRTGKVVNLWVSVSQSIKYGARITLENMADYAEFVIGTFIGLGHKQFFHTVTGWQSLYKRTEEIKTILRTQIQIELNRITGKK